MARIGVDAGPEMRRPGWTPRPAAHDAAELQAERMATSAVAAPATTSTGHDGHLDAATLARQERRFGFRFDDVRIHDDRAAGRRAARQGALAFTEGGNHIFFARGRYAPHTPAGDRILAHELTHVLQQRHAPGFVASPATPQAMKLGQGKSQLAGGTPVVEVPEEERPRVEGAMRRMAEVAENPGRYPACHDYFASRCPGGHAGTLEKTFRDAVLWRVPDEEGDLAGAIAETPGTNLAYTRAGYRAGEEELAGYLMHELLHSCGVEGGDEHYKADVGRIYCMGAGKSEILPRVSRDAAANWHFLLGYRRVLHSWLGGKTQLTFDADVDPIGGLQELAGEKDDARELVSAGVGVRQRFNPWGGERWGGLSLHGDLGLGAQRLRLRQSGETALGGGVILEVGARAEFRIPDLSFREGRRQAFGVDLSYRMIQPLNSEAERLHQVLFGLVVPWR